MMEIIMVLIEAVLVAGLGVWMALAVYDNWRHPELNREAVRMVMQFEVMEKEYPDDFAIVAHRKVESMQIINTAFQIIRLMETLAAVALLISAGLLLGSALGLATSEGAMVIALLAVTFFCMIWAGFIIGGNYFHYYYCHQWGQSNHFMFMYWGLFVLVILLL